MPTIVWLLEGQDATLTETLRRVGTTADEMGTKGSAAWLRLQQANAAYATTLERIDAQMAHYIQVQADATTGSARYEQAELRLIALDGQLDAATQRQTAAQERYAQSLLKAAEGAEAAAAKEAAAAEKAAMAVVAAREKEQNAFGNMIGSAAENVLVYGTLYSLYGKLTQGVTDFTKALFDNAAANEKFVAFANASVGGGNARLQDILQQGTSVQGGGLPLKDLEALDQRLQLLGVTAENTQQRFGRSLGQVRADLVTLSSLPGLDSTKAAEFFSRAEDGANRLALSLQSAGLTTRAQLEAMGVTFKGTGNQIVSTNEQTTEAVLKLIETKWGTLSAINATTWDGVTTRIRNFSEEATGILGKDITSQFERNWNHLLDTMASPQGTQALQQWGAGLGQFVNTLTKVNEALTDTIFHMADAQAIITGQPSHLADAYQAWLQHNAALDAAAAAASAASAAADHHTAALGAEADAAAQTAAAVAIYNASLQDARDAMNQVNDAERAALAPIQAHTEAMRQAQATQDAVFSRATAQLQDQLDSEQEAIKAIQATQAGVDAAASAAVDRQRTHLQDLQDQSTALGEHYAALIQPWKDLETQQNRVYENQQRATRLGDVNARIATDVILAKDVGSPEGRAAAARLLNEREQAGQLQGEIAHAGQIQNDQDHITALERAQKVAQDGVKDQEAATQRSIQGIETARKNADAYYRAEIASEQVSVERTQDNLKTVETARKAADAFYQAEIAIDATHLKTAQAGFQAQKDTLLEIEHSLERQIHAVEAAGKQAQIDTQATSLTVLGTINQAVGTVTGTVQGLINALAQAGIGSGSGPTYPGTSSGVPPAESAPGGPGNSPDFGRPQSTAPGGQHVHVTVGFDDSLHPYVVKTVQGQIRNPANGAGASAALSWAGG